jgi:hypothetical protein
MVFESTTATFDAVGAGPVPFSKSTWAPPAKFNPVTVAATVVPACIVFGAIAATTTVGLGVGVLVGVPVGVTVGVLVGVLVAVAVGVLVGVNVFVGVLVGVPGLSGIHSGLAHILVTSGGCGKGHPFGPYFILCLESTVTNPRNLFPS